MRRTMMSIYCLTVPSWETFPGLVHAFLGRTGGESAPPYASLNLSYRVGDDLSRVKENWCQVKKTLGIHAEKVTLMRQVHGNRVLTVSEAGEKEAGEGDAMITDRPDVFLGILTADCVPILLVEPQRQVVAAIHAGWRGTLHGVIEQTLTRLQEGYGIAPSALYAALGPAIEGCCYEVGSEIYTRIMTRWGQLARPAWRVTDGRYYLDLRTLHTALLQHLGLSPAQILRVGPCTGCHTDRFFSHRKEAGKTGRQASIIGWYRHA
ncbi:MAG: peptidoglycan editing factor PgeF [Nitrospinota bacterium]|nr:MAG: peptidoglycan editing factor PgeF [Nitrospinota bacterium]